MSRMLTDYTKLVKDESVSILTADDMTSIEVQAGVLDLEQCLDYLGIEKLEEAEMATATRIHKRGRAKAIAEASSNLFSSMKNRNGHQAALEYLRQMSDSFALELEDRAVAGTGFSFNVVMPEDK